MTSRVRGIAVSIVFVGGCMGNADFQDTVASALVRSDREAVEARSCADELRAITERVPGAADAALEFHDTTGAPFLRPGDIARGSGVDAARARSEIARRERALRGDRKAIEASVVVGPAALARLDDAVEDARRVRATLCQARDRANELVARIDPHALPQQAMSLK